MLPRRQRIRTASVFGDVRREGRTAHSAFLVVGARLRLDDTQGQARFGFIVSKRVGNATVRNLVKRRLRAIAQSVGQDSLGWDVVVTAKPAAAGATYTQLLQTMGSAITRATNRGAHSTGGPA